MKKLNYYKSEFKQSKIVHSCTLLPYLLENNKKGVIICSYRENKHFIKNHDFSSKIFDLFMNYFLFMRFKSK